MSSPPSFETDDSDRPGGDPVAVQSPAAPRQGDYQDPFPHDANTAPRSASLAEESPPRITRRRGACRACRLRKVRCDGARPCVTCERTGQECYFPELRPRPQRRYPYQYGAMSGTGAELRGVRLARAPYYHARNLYQEGRHSFYQQQPQQQYHPVQVLPPTPTSATPQSTFPHRDSAISVPLNLDLDLGLDLDMDFDTSPRSVSFGPLGGLISPLEKDAGSSNNNNRSFAELCFDPDPRVQPPQTPCSMILQEHGAGDASGQEINMSWCFDELVDYTAATPPISSNSPPGSSITVSLPTPRASISLPTPTSPSPTQKSFASLSVSTSTTPISTSGMWTSGPDPLPVELDFSAASTYGLLAVIQRRAALCLVPNDAAAVVRSLHGLREGLVPRHPGNRTAAEDADGGTTKMTLTTENAWSPSAGPWHGDLKSHLKFPGGSEHQYTRTQARPRPGHRWPTSWKDEDTPDPDANRAGLWRVCEAACFSADAPFPLGSVLHKGWTSRLVRKALRYGPDAAGTLVTIFVGAILCIAFCSDASSSSSADLEDQDKWWSDFRHPDRILALARRWLPECRPGSLLKLQTMLVLGGVVAQMAGDDTAVCEFLTTGVGVAREMRLMGGSYLRRAQAGVAAQRRTAYHACGELPVEEKGNDGEGDGEDDEDTAGTKAVEFLRRMDVEYALQHGIVPLLPSSAGFERSDDTFFTSLMHSILLLQDHYQQQQQNSNSNTDSPFPSPSTLSQPLSRWIAHLPPPLSHLHPSHPSLPVQSRALTSLPHDALSRRRHTLRLLGQYHAAVFLTYAPWLAITPSSDTENYAAYLTPCIHSAAALIQGADQHTAEEDLIALHTTGADRVDIGQLLLTAVCVVVLCLLDCDGDKDREGAKSRQHRAMMANLGACCGLFGRLALRDEQTRGHGERELGTETRAGLLDCVLDLARVLRSVGTGS